MSPPLVFVTTLLLVVILASHLSLVVEARSNKKQHQHSKYTAMAHRQQQRRQNRRSGSKESVQSQRDIVPKDTVDNNNYNRKRGKKVAPRGTPKKFVVLHDDPMALAALTLMLHHSEELVKVVQQPQSSSSPPPSPADVPSIWLYDDMPRWHEPHARSLLNFECGYTRGSQGDCSYAKYHHDSSSSSSSSGEKKDDPSRSSTTTANPDYVGISLDLNLLVGNKHCLEEVLKHKAPVVALVPSNILSGSLRDAYTNPLNPLTADIPGRHLGVARSQYMHDAKNHLIGAGHNDVTGLSRIRPMVEKVHNRHSFMLCPDDANPSRLFRVLLKQHNSHRSLLATINDFKAANVPVLEIKVDDIRRHTNQTLANVYKFLLDSTATATNQSCYTLQNLPVTAGGSHHPSVRETIAHLIAAPRHVVLDCEATIEAARVRVAVESKSKANAKRIIDDMDQLRNTMIYHHHQNARGQQGPNGVRTSVPKTRPGRQ